MGTKTEKKFAMGLCGKNLAWMLDDGVLTIAGEGELEIAGGVAPWNLLRDSIASVVIEEGATDIGEWTFSNCTGLSSVSIPDSVTSIDGHVFHGCTSLTSVTIGSGVTYVGWGSFLKCHRLTDVYYGGTRQDWATVKFGSGNDALKNAAIHFGK